MDERETNEQQEQVQESEPKTLKQAFWERLKTLCPQYGVTPYNKDLLRSMALYLARDKEYESFGIIAQDTFTFGDLSLDKGILICGDTGTGKTTILTALCDLILCEYKDEGGNSVKLPVSRVNCRDIDPGLLDGRKTHYDRGVWFFDDLGNERESQYAKKSDLKGMHTILERRHFNKNLTFATTNLAFFGEYSDFAKAYGQRLESRIHEMFNLYVLGGKDYRR